MFKKILLVLLALIAAFVIYVALQPDAYKVERSVTVAAPAAKVFENVNNLRKWEAWSPWAKLDPNAKVMFQGPEAGNGAAMSWDGNDNVGAGKMTIVESDPDKAVNIKVTFTRPFEGGTNSDFSFTPKGDQTEVAWAMHGTHSFVEKAFCVVFGGLGMMGKDIDKGLSQLKAVAEQS
ncbi:polyketide cyclase [Methyloceanibacter methanicus]|uniref:Polyketide cyclase n=1 Tax=Methyloceanibacter methanicus TaxID=1774968 RepID=A0A1E3VZ14_9HYPH|nr:SRPBCC family protein [Methyloceanibacter methanicus]ODR98788.1 polyketide cyclase [Methyloceanibacter methanicus]